MISKDLSPPRKSSLEDRINQIRAEIDVIVSARVEAVAGESPGVPRGVIRKLLTARAPLCLCSQYLELREARGVAKDSRQE